MKKKNKMSKKTLEDISLDALYQHCPLCGRTCKNFYCKKCDFKYKKGYLYFSIPNKINL